MQHNVKRPFIPFHQKLFGITLVTFLAFVFFLGVYQYLREKEYRIGLLAGQLQSYNTFIQELIEKNGLSDSLMKLEIARLSQQHLRVSVVDFKGKVLYDNMGTNLKNHADRPEIIKAMAYGAGTSVRRTSATLGIPFFYSATRYPKYIVRTALPYDQYLNKKLNVNHGFITFSLLLLVLMLSFLYRTTRRLGKTIAQLRDFAQSADKNRLIDSNQQFPNNELGEISQHIVAMFKRISKTRDELFMEREKLIAHLQISHEGLAVFAPDRKVIFANSLFIQYIHLISNTPAESANVVFQIPELAEIKEYLHQAEERMAIGLQMHRLTMRLSKNGKIFQVTGMVFQDKSFEVSIYDVTKKEEENRLKRQLTQNIAHELRTPVSSIQGYLETLVSTPDLPLERMQMFIDRSYIQSKRLVELLKDIATLTRMDEAPELIEKSPVHLYGLIQRIYAELEPEFEKKRIAFHLDVDEKLTINGNASLLYSIFRNLTDNALAYAGENIEIVVICFRNDLDFCYFSFYDTGCGVPEEHLNRLFERFYRVDKGRSRKMGGTGLGLAIVKNAVVHHGGSIMAKNRPHGGLEFVFSLAK